MKFEVVRGPSSSVTANLLTATLLTATVLMLGGVSCTGELGPLAGSTETQGTGPTTSTGASIGAGAGGKGGIQPEMPRLVDESDRLPPNSSATVDVLLVDLDGDDDKDIVWVNQDYPTVDPVRVKGSLEFSINTLGEFEPKAPSVGETELEGWYDWVQAADVDKDGDQDLILSRPAASRDEVALLLNDGKGSFVKSTDLPSITGTADGLVFGRVAVGDVDMDGDVDIFVPIFSNLDTTADRANILLINDDSGKFTRDAMGSLPPLPQFEDYTLGAAIGDLDGDGAPDLFLGEAEDTPRILINDGMGRFSDQTDNDGSGVPRIPKSAASLKLRAFRTEMFDLDADGDLDVVVVNDVAETSGPQSSYAFFNDGSGHFAEVPFPDVPGSTYAVAFGDLNGDALPDVVLARGNDVPGPALEFLLNAGSEQFVSTQVPDVGPWTVGVFGVAVADLNGDGRADIAGAVGVPAPNDPSENMSNLLLFSKP